MDDINPPLVITRSYKPTILLSNMKKRNVLLVEPDFPYPNRSKHSVNEIHKNFAPVGLLKLGAYHKFLGNRVKLIRGNKEQKEIGFLPDEILITSLFTYWSKYVWASVEHYRTIFPKSKIIMGGIYATLHKDTEEFIKNAKEFKITIHSGIHKEAEKFLPDYNLLNSKLDYHITHAMRGCIRRCSFCGTWRIEPKLMYKSTDELINELKKAGKNKVIFFDNNFFANPNIKDILRAIADLRINNKPLLFESQSGFDGRLLERDPELAKLLRNARFKEIRIAWDNGLEDKNSIKKQIDFLVEAGYPAKEIYVFMIYNFNRPYEDMLKKVKCCKKWQVQIVDCRYRPLTATYDNYKPHKFKEGQTNKDYYIHETAGWTDAKIRNFRKSVRQHNMEIRYTNGKKYNPDMEKWSAIHHTYKFFSLDVPPKMNIIRKNKRISNRITLLNRLKNYYLKNKFEKPNFKDLTKREINHKVDLLVKKYIKEKT